MKKYFPSQEQGYFQTNRSDDLGSLWSTMNVDLQTNLGVLRVSPRLKLISSTADLSNMGLPVAFKDFDGRMWAICGARIFWSDSTIGPQGTYTQDSSVNTQTDYAQYSDAEVFGTTISLVTTTNDAVVYKQAAAGDWSVGLLALTSGDAHPLCYFKKFNKLYVGFSSTLVASIDPDLATTRTSGDYTLTLTSTIERITCLRATSQNIWVGTRNSASLNSYGAILQWDGISAQPTNKYLLDANGCLAILIDNDIPYAMDSNGVLLQFTGSSFEEIGRLPINEKLLINATGSSNRFIHPNGMLATKNGTIQVLVNNLNGDNGQTINENFPAGVWEWSKENGFVHRYSLSYNPIGSSTITDYGQNRVSVVGALANANIYNTNASRNGTTYVGATFYTNASSTSSGVFIDDSNNTIQKKGYFVTTWFNSDEIQDKWTRLWEVHRRLLDSDDSIVYKYRLNEEDPVEASITWVNTTSFTTTTNITAYGPTATGFNGTSGGEVEILQGTGSGACVHITDISENGGTYTVTVDTAVTGVTTGTAKARFQKWIKLFPVVTGQVRSWEQMSIGAPNTRIQIKGCMTFKGNDEFHKFVLVSNEDIKANS